MTDATVSRWPMIAYLVSYFVTINKAIIMVSTYMYLLLLHILKSPLHIGVSHSLRQIKFIQL